MSFLLNPFIFSTVKNKAYFDGVGDYLTIPYSTDFIFSSGAFCIEFIASFTPVAALKYIVAMGNNTSAAGTNFDLDLLATGKLSFNFYASTSGKTTSGNTVVTDGIPRHYCIVRNGDEFTLYINGVADATATFGFTMNSNVYPLAIGALTNASGAIPMNLYGFKITKGIPRYTASFTPPTEFINDANTVLCMNFAEPIGSTTFIDDTGKTVTTNGNVIIVA